MFNNNFCVWPAKQANCNWFFPYAVLAVVLWGGLPSAASAQTRPLQTVHWHLTEKAGHSLPIGRLSGDVRLNLTIGLPLRNQVSLSSLLGQIYDPASTNYHHYLTPEEFAERFGPTEADYQATIAFAIRNGLKVTATHPNRTLLEVSGTVTEVERALHVKMLTYHHPVENRVYYAPDTEPTLDLSNSVLQISGLDNYSLPHPRLVARPLFQGQNVSANTGSGPQGTYLGKDFRAAYVPDSRLDGSGQIVGLLQFDGYTASDISYYESQAGLPSIPLSNVLLDGFSGLPTGSGGEVEVSLDIEMSISMATNLSKVIVYEAGPNGNWHDILNRMATDNLAKQLSCSWYIPNGGADPVADQIFQQMAAQGQSFFSASGDDDAYTGLIPFPGDSPYITEVGGTTLTTSGPGGTWDSETVWNWGNGIGSGGGISTQYPIPAWQTNINMTASQGSTVQRNTPDVALTADNVYVRADGHDYFVGGTSCAAPLWAGFTALVNQQARFANQPAVGFINPAIDAIGSGSEYSADFHDISTGNNESPASPSKFSAVTGYDLCTGWGTPAGQHLINALANPEPLQISPQTGFSSIGGVGGPFTVTSQSLVLTNSGTNTLNWILVNTSLWLSASSASGTLKPAGPADTVTVSLNSTASNLLVGNYTADILFTNLNDNTGQGRQFTLSIISPPSITQQPTNQAVLDGETAMFGVGVSGGQPMYFQWQYNSKNLTDGGNIVGSATTGLTINSASQTNVGAYSIIVSNAAGVVSSSNASLTIIPSAPVITLQPSNETVVVTGTAQFSVSAVGTKPFSYQWNFDGTNIVGATNASLTLTDLQFDESGIYAVVITNIHGAIESSNSILTVSPCDPVPPGIVSWWPGENSPDDIIGGNNGTLSGSVSYGPGEVGQAFVFSADQAVVELGSPTNLYLQNFTIESWIKRSSTSVSSLDYNDADLFAFGVGGYGFGLFANGNLFLTQIGTGNVSVGTTVTNTSWHHVAVTKNGGTVVFYVDGVAYPASGYNPTFVFNSAVALGANGGSQGNSFYGSIDELSVYSGALSANEIQSIYLAGGGGKCFTPTQPSIIDQPADQTVTVGQSTSFSVSASGTPPLMYQWSFDGTNIAGATNTTITLNNLQFANAGYYGVLVSNLAGSILSSNAVLTVDAPAPCDPAPSGIVSWWPAEGNADDIIGGNNGTLSGSVSYGPGEVGQAFVFSADQAVVQLGSPTNLYLQNFTIESWIKRSSTSVSSLDYNDADLFAFGVGGYGFGLFANGNLFLTQVGTGNVSVGTTVTNTSWHHVAVTKNGGTVVFYVDGVAYPAPGYNPTFVFSSPVALGANGGSQWNSFYGAIDELSVYSRALSVGEIQNIYLAGAGGKCPPASAPTIYSQPANQTVTVGQNASFSVYASGTLPLKYQWSFDGTNIADATNATLTLSDVQFTNTGNYAVLVSNLIGSILSSNAELVVEGVPCEPVPSGIVSWWPAEGNADDIIGGYNGILSGSVSYGPGEVGQAFVFSADQAVVQLGSPTNLYLQNFTIESWIKRSSTSVSSLDYNDADLFAFGVGGYGFGLFANGNLFLTQVGTGNVSVGTTVTNTSWHHVAVTKNGGTVVFYVDGVAFPASSYNPTFVFSSPVALGANGGSQWNSFYGAIDELSVYSRALSVGEIQNIYLAGAGGKCPPASAPTIYSQPANQTVTVGQNASFSVYASGTLPLKYQWSFNGTSIADATNATLTLSDVQFTNNGNYAVLVSNLAGSILSSNAVLTVNMPTPCDPAPPGIVSWWPAEGNADDIIGGNNGTLSGSVSYGPGEVGQAFVFSADQAVVQLGRPTNLYLQNFTVESWIKRSSTSVSSLDYNDADLFAFGVGGYGFGLFANGNLFLTQVGTGNVSVGTTVTNTSWHHVAVTKNGGTVVFYVDGAAYPAPGYNPTFVFSSPVALGANGGSKWNSFYGAIDELSVYSRALSASEIQNIYLAGSGGKCSPFAPPAIIGQPTNQTVTVGQSASFSVSASSALRLTYQWKFDETNISGATNATLILNHVQFADAGDYAVLVSDQFDSIISSNAVLFVNDRLDHFAWNQIPSPRFVDVPFTVVIEAEDPANALFTNFNGTVSLSAVSGLSINPSVSTAFNQGIWTGSITVSQPATNLVLQAMDNAGDLGLGNVIDVVNPPTLEFNQNGSLLFMYWPITYPNFVLEISASLSPAEWVQIANPPLQIGNQYFEAIQIGNSNEFYRLHFIGP
jgi:hypothetical protein